MPQNTLIDPPEQRIFIELEDLTWCGEPAFRLHVKLQRIDEIPRTVSVTRWTAGMVDDIAGGVREAAAAWLYSNRESVADAVGSFHLASRRMAADRELR